MRSNGTWLHSGDESWSVCCAESSAGRCRGAHVANFCSAYGKRRPVKVTLLVAASRGRTQVRVDACCTLPRWIPVTHKSTYTDPAQVIFVCFFSFFSKIYMWLARSERFELPASWFVVAMVIL